MSKFSCKSCSSYNEIHRRPSTLYFIQQIIFKESGFLNTKNLYCCKEKVSNTANEKNLSTKASGD